MKKIFGLLLIPALFLVVCLTGCDKEITYKVRITCCYSETGIDTGDVVSDCYVNIGEENYADYAKASGVTNENGIFEHQFMHEALLTVRAHRDTTYVGEDGVENSMTTHVGIGQVKLLPNEVVEQTILLMRQ